MSSRAPVTLLSFGSRDKSFREGSLSVRILGRPWQVRGSRFNPVSLRVLPEVLRHDVIHCHQRFVLVSQLAAIAGCGSRRPVFVTDLGGGGWNLAQRLPVERCYRGFLHISEYSRRISDQQDEPRARVIFSGVDTGKFTPDSAEPKTGGLLFVGRLLPHKGIDRVLAALPADIRMDIVGQPYHREYRALLGELARGKQVFFHEDFDDRRLLEAYRRSRAVVLPSLYRDYYGNETVVPELMGQTLLEGMSCGIPAICTNVAAMPESVVDGVTGYVVPPDDLEAMRRAIVALCTEENLAARMGAAARERMVAHFTWEAVVDRCLDAYRS
jgi:glycosyltransferase involved in cell wall biosynthesis